MKAELNDKKNAFLFTFESVSEVLKVWRNELLTFHTEYETNFNKFMNSICEEFKMNSHWSSAILSDYNAMLPIHVNMTNEDIYEFLQRYKYFLMAYEIELTFDMSPEWNADIMREEADKAYNEN